MKQNEEMLDRPLNPLDGIEDILASQDWVFDRPNPDELSVVLSSQNAAYRITFMWQQEVNAMHFFCEFDVTVPEDRRASVAVALLTVNARLWIGHFILQEHSGVPCFRHTSIHRDWTNALSTGHVEDLVEIALAECDRHRGIFTMLSGSTAPDPALLTLALSQPAGQA